MTNSLENTSEKVRFSTEDAQRYEELSAESKRLGEQYAPLAARSQALNGKSDIQSRAERETVWAEMNPINSRRQDITKYQLPPLDRKLILSEAANRTDLGQMAAELRKNLEDPFGNRRKYEDRTDAITTIGGTENGWETMAQFIVDACDEYLSQEDFSDCHYAYLIASAVINRFNTTFNVELAMGRGEPHDENFGLTNAIEDTIKGARIESDNPRARVAEILKRAA